MQGGSTMIKRIVVVSGILIICLLAILFAANQSYIAINTEGGSADTEYTYEITDQKSGKTSTKVSGASLKTRVPRGSYQVLVRGSGNSGFAVIKTSGFFRTTTKTIPIDQEKVRQFVGQNPFSCMNYVDSVLLSYNCNGRVNDIQVHVPATATSPSYTQKISSIFDGYIQGSFENQGTTYVVVSIPPGTEGLGPPFGLYKINGTSVEFQHSLSGLTQGELYAIKPFKDGFVAISRKTGSTSYFPITSKTAEAIDMSFDNSDLSLVAANTSGNTIMAEYSNDIGDSTDQKSKNQKTKTVLVVNTDGQKATYEFPTIFSSFVMCGDNLLCAAGEPDTLFVYQLGGKKPELQYTISGTQAVANVGTSTIVVRSSDVLRLDASSATATIPYSFGDYSYCGIAPLADSFLLCIRSDKGTNALLIGSADTEYKIDQQVSKLEQSSDVKNLGAYGSYVFITPNLGPLVYNERTKSFGYSDAAKEAVGKRLIQQVNDLGLKEAGYQPIYLGL